VQLAVLHQVKVISNWMKCLRFAIGSSFSGDSAFALMFVLYNPVSRKDVANKQQQFIQKLANALLSLHQEYVGKSRFFLFGIRRSWIYFKFAIMHFDEDCSPVSVSAAVDEPHAAFLKHVARLNMVIKRGAKKRNTKPSTLLRKIQNVWGRRNSKVSPGAVAQDLEADAPQYFIDEFVSKRDFIAENIDDDARLTMITLLLFDRIEDFGEDIDCKHYLRKIFDDGAACRAAMRSIYDASQELSQRAAADDACSGVFVSFWRRLQSWVLFSVFGQDAVKSINCFHRLSNEQQNELMQTHNFPQAGSITFSTKTADDVVARCLAQSEAATKHAAQNALDLTSLALGQRDFGSAPLYREQPAVNSAFQRIVPSNTTVAEGSNSQKSHADARRFLDLEAQVSELKAANSELKKLLNSSRTELKQALIASQTVQKP